MQMRRLLALAATLAVVAGPLAAGGRVWAKEHGEGPRGGDHRGGEGRWEGGHGGGPPGWRGGGEPPGWARRGDPRGEFRGEPRGEPGGGERYGGYEGRGYPAPPQAYAPPRRGGYIGPYGGAPIEDPGRYRLREAPRGYSWMRVPGGMALVSRSTGQVFDVVPDGR